MLPESRTVHRLMGQANTDWAHLEAATLNSDRAGAIGRLRLTLDRLADANIAERYAIAADRAASERK
jgi:hypothetical protein